MRLSTGLSIRTVNNQVRVLYVEIARDGTRLTNDNMVDLLVNSIVGGGAPAPRPWAGPSSPRPSSWSTMMPAVFTLCQANPSTCAPNLVPVLDGESINQPCATNGSSGDGGGGATTSTPPTAETADTPPILFHQCCRWDRCWRRGWLGRRRGRPFPGRPPPPERERERLAERARNIVGGMSRQRHL